MYRVNNLEVPSVTTILDVLNKPALVWWGMKVGVAGVKKLEELDDARCPECGSSDILGEELDTIVGKLTENKITVNHVKESAGRRGDSAHKLFEYWAKHGHIPDPLPEYPEDEAGYIAGLLEFLVDAHDKMKPRATEVMVGSEEHEFAGRFDLKAEVDACELVTKANKKPKKAVVDGYGLIDLKTTKYVYPSHHLQLAAYEGGGRECGYAETDFRAVLRVTADGRYEFVVTDRPCWDAFLAVKNAHKAMQYMKGKYVAD